MLTRTAWQLLAPVRGQGVQAAPAAGSGAGGGGLPAPPAAGGSCGPQPGDGTPLVPDPSLLSLLPGGNQNQDGSSGGQSFTGDTRVLLPGGKSAPISSLKPGDKVLATDTKTGKDQPETVTAVEVHHDSDLYNLTVKTKGGTEVIHTTASHLFWDPVKRQWVKAASLRKGEPLRTPGATTTAVADGGNVPANHEGQMWDLTIPGNGDHDFYVLPAQPSSHRTYRVVAGSTPVLVHNCVDPEVQDLGAMTGPGQTNLWDMPNRDKGLAFEQQMGMSNLPAGFKAFDQFEPDSGVALSLKSMDTSLPGLNKTGQFYQRLMSAIDDVSNYGGDYRYPGVLTPRMISQRVLYVITNSNTPLTDMQIAQMSRAVGYGYRNGVTVLFGGSTG